MHVPGVWILTFTILLHVTVSQGISNSSFNTCYFNENQSSQCPSGESCTIVPPENMRVRRRASYPEQDKQPSRETWFPLTETRRRGKGGKGGRSGGTGRSSSRGGSGSSTTGKNSNWRYGTRLSKQYYGMTAVGVTSAFVGFGAWNWLMKSPSPYYRWRESNNKINNLKKNQGICTDKQNLRLMTQQDCYNWCMSDIYNDKTCAIKCGLEKEDTTWKTALMIILPIVIVFSCCLGLCLCLYKKGYIHFYYNK